MARSHGPALAASGLGALLDGEVPEATPAFLEAAEFWRLAGGHNLTNVAVLDRIYRTPDPELLMLLLADFNEATSRP